MASVVPGATKTEDPMKRLHEEFLRRAKEDRWSVLHRRGPHLFSGGTHRASEYTSSCEGDMPLPHVQKASVE